MLDLVVQQLRDTAAALRVLRWSIRNQGHPETAKTDGIKSYGAAFTKLDPRHPHRPGRLRENNRAENSQLPGGVCPDVGGGCPRLV